MRSGAAFGAESHLADEVKGSKQPMMGFPLGLSDKPATAREWNIR
jgi:hypothetical protein